jgi:hypothetical protein
MKKVVASILVTVGAVVLTLAAVTVLIEVTIRISEMTNPALRAVAVMAELLAGIFWLLGTVYLATHMAVLIFGDRTPPRV